MAETNLYAQKTVLDNPKCRQCRFHPICLKQVLNSAIGALPAEGEAFEKTGQRGGTMMKQTFLLSEAEKQTVQTHIKAAQAVASRRRQYMIAHMKEPDMGLSALRPETCFDDVSKINFHLQTVLELLGLTE